MAVHGDDFTFCGTDEDLDWIQGLMTSWFEVKIRARLGPDDEDDKGRRYISGSCADSIAMDTWTENSMVQKVRVHLVNLVCVPP